MAPFSWLFQLFKGKETQGMGNEFQEINMESEREEGVLMSVLHR